jgi:hypothetical protein
MELHRLAVSRPAALAVGQDYAQSKAEFVVGPNECGLNFTLAYGGSTVGVR